MGLVLVDSPPFPLELVTEVLGDIDIEARPRPWAGADVVGLLVWDPIGEADFERLPGLRVVATCSVGFDHIDLVAAARRQVWVCHVPDYCTEEMADSTIALVLALLRGVVVLDRSVRSGAWDDHAAGALPRLSGLRLGVVGFGRIGRSVARRALALGFDVCASDPLVANATIAAAGVRPATLVELLSGATVVTLHLPLTPQTRGLIGERELALMPKGAYVVNTARAGLLDWTAFLEALDRGHLAGAAVDVLPVEPPTALNPAPRHDRLIVTPHAAWYSSRSEDQVYRRAAQSVKVVLEGRVPDGAVVRPSGFAETRT